MQKNLTLQIPEWNKNDFFASTEPFEWLYQYKDNKFLLAQLREQIKERAGNVGVKNFISLWNNYLAMKKQQAGENLDNVTEFTDQPCELFCESYICNDYGITAFDRTGYEVIVCRHPIIPIKRLINIDTGEEKVEIAYRRAERWKSIIVDKFVISSVTKIIELAKYGVSVDSESAKELVKFLSTIIDLNYEFIPEARSIKRMGYIEGYGFAPYVENLVFDGEIEFAKIYNSVKQKGDFAEWKKVATKCRKMSIAAKILLAASFASPLLSVLNALPFFVHLWGAESGTGKTVALMLAASVWGDPKVGEYIKTFNATDVGNEKTAAFLNHLPFCIDELQLIKGANGKISFNAYKLAQGVGRTRGNKLGGVEITPTWHNCILTTGESPITSESSGMGAYNRIIEIECIPDKPVITNGNEISTALLQNYGFAGREFVMWLYGNKERLQECKKRYKEIFSELLKEDTTEKQSMAMAAVLLADEIATKMFFDNTDGLNIEEIKGFMTSKQAMSVGKRAYDYICSWIAKNSSKFDSANAQYIEMYGVINGDTAYIIRSALDDVLNEAGFNPQSVYSWLKCNNYIETDFKNQIYTKVKKINGISVRCIWLRLPEADENSEFADEIF